MSRALRGGTCREAGSGLQEQQRQNGRLSFISALGERGAAAASPEQVSGDGTGSLAGVRGWGRPRPEPPQADEMKSDLANLKVLVA